MFISVVQLYGFQSVKPLTGKVYKTLPSLDGHTYYFYLFGSLIHSSLMFSVSVSVCDKQPGTRTIYHHEGNRQPAHNATGQLRVHGFENGDQA